MKIAIPFLLLSMLPAMAQSVKFPPELEKLASKAVETTNVTLDSAMLQSMSGLLGKDVDAKKAQELASKLKGIWVRSFTFAKEGEYSQADVESIRSAIRGPAWTSIVSVRTKEETAEVAVKRESGRVVSLVVLAAEPMELTFVNIDGPLDLSELGSLGSLGVPNISSGFRRAPKPGTQKK